jgi:peptide deformylase
MSGRRGRVVRAKSIQYIARRIDGEPLRGIAESFHARIIQREIDHLDGVLYTDIALGGVAMCVEIA